MLAITVEKVSFFRNWTPDQLSRPENNTASPFVSPNKNFFFDHESVVFIGNSHTLLYLILTTATSEELGRAGGLRFAGI